MIIATPVDYLLRRVALPRSPNGASGPMVRRCAGLQGPQGSRHDPEHIRGQATTSSFGEVASIWRTYRVIE